MEVKRLLIIYTFAIILCLMFGVAYADGPPNLYFDINGDGAYDDTEWQINSETGKIISVDIYLDDLNGSPYSSEPIFGVAMFFYYDNTKFKANKGNSFANDTSHGGPFDPSFGAYFDEGGGKLRLEAADFNCIDTVDRVLVYTVGLEQIAAGASEIKVSADYPKGSVLFGGGDCKKNVHSEDFGPSSLLLIGDDFESEEKNDDEDESEEKTSSSTTTAVPAGTTIPDTATIPDTETSAGADTSPDTKATETTGIVTGRKIVSGRNRERGVAETPKINVETIIQENERRTTPEKIRTLPGTKTILQTKGPTGKTLESSVDAKTDPSETTTTIYSPYRIIIAPAASMIGSGSQLQLSAKTFFEENEIEGNSKWEIIPPSTIGSKVDKNGQFIAGNNNIGYQIQETVRVTDTLHENNFTTANIIVKVKELPPKGCELQINLSSGTVLSGDTIRFFAKTSGDKCLQGAYKWHINSNIGSDITSEGVYTAEDNSGDESAIDIITVKDTVNGLSLNTIVTVLPRQKIVRAGSGSIQKPQSGNPSGGGGSPKILIIIVAAVLFLIGLGVYRRIRR